MMKLEELEKIQPGDYVEWTEHFLGNSWTETGEVKEVAVRCGLDEDGHIREGYDDYMIVKDFTYGYDTEVSYRDIIRFNWKD